MTTSTHSILQSNFPVDTPHFPQLLISDTEFVKHLELVYDTINKPERKTNQKDVTTSNMSLDEQTKSSAESPFIKALHLAATRGSPEHMAAANLKYTENGDLTHASSQDALVDLFYKLSEDVVDKNLLAAAWECDPLATVKIIFNARSIHLGKSSRVAAYRALGWLYREHTMTFLVNLPWLVRPVIAKPKPKKREEGEDDTSKKDDGGKVETEKFDEDDDDFVIVVPQEGASFHSMAMDRINGLAHGYWKDLLNMLTLAVHGHLDSESDPKVLLNIQGQGRGRKHVSKKPVAKTQGRRIFTINEKAQKQSEYHAARRNHFDQKLAKQIRDTKIDNRHTVLVNRLQKDGRYRLFHFAVARLFANQLKHDLALLNSPREMDKLKISLAAKWAPSLKEFHDKHTWIATSIAEILFTHDQVCPKDTPKSDRTTYLKYARMEYQFKVLSPLRKALDIVERNISAETFEDIKYQKVPSLAMERYSNLFLKKDEEHYNQYLDDVADGKQSISGAVLLPSVMVSKVMPDQHHGRRKLSRAELDAQKRVIDLQWRTLVQHVKDSGKLTSSIAVCDVSGSMSYPQRADGTTPMHAAVGLSLLLSEVCEEPFGGTIITFDEKPSVFKVGGTTDGRSFTEKVRYIMSQPWGMSTNFEAVFTKLILPVAVANKLKQEDMVKQIFVFSDMQFNAADQNSRRWSSSYKRIKAQFKKAGYETPVLIFWNLAAGDKGVPVESSEPGTALVSGYSQGQMKVFLDGGGFGGDAEDEEQEDEIILDGAGTEVKIKKEKKGVDPVQVMRRAISHEGYSMLRVVDI